MPCYSSCQGDPRDDMAVEVECPGCWDIGMMLDRNNGGADVLMFCKRLLQLLLANVRISRGWEDG